MLEKFINRPTWAEINLDHLASNFHSIKTFIGNEINFMAVVKADGYGHGAIECAKRLEKEGVDWFGVALLEEAVQLRENKIKSPILCLGGFWNGQEKLLIEHSLTPVVYQIDAAQTLDEISRKNNLITNIHIKVDTGMGRIGVRFDQFAEFADRISELKNLRVDGILSHFAVADDLSQNIFTNEQINKFNRAVEIAESKGFPVTFKDLANSPGAIAHKNSRSNMVRIGGILYGLGDNVIPQEIARPKLKPVLSLYSKIAYLKKVPKGETLGYSRTFTTARDSIIATVPIGYHDGYNRCLSNKSKVIIREILAPVVGRISMDWTIVDVTDVPDVEVNDEVVLIGESADVKVSSEQLAKICETISYEITCGISSRVARKYVGA